MKITFNAILVGFLLSVAFMLCGCNTTKGLSQDVNQASDSIHDAINS